jgi:hypothetical protein
MPLRQVSTLQQIDASLSAPREANLQIWVTAPQGGTLSAFFVDAEAWLMYLRHDGDSGFSSRNPSYTGAPDAARSFILENGQVDEFPSSWFYPEAIVAAALREFAAHGRRPEGIAWHED